MISIRKRKRIIVIILVITIFFTVSNVILDYKLGLNFKDIVSLRLPIKDNIKIEFSKKYIIPNKSYFEKQKRSQCGGYSSAYVLRFLGEKVKGEEIYSSMNYKLSNGYVLPQALIQTFDKYDVSAELYSGTLDTLKTRLANGIPIIVIIGDGFKWQHYVTVTGYDENNIYLYDSNFENETSKSYNRTISNSEFINTWKNKLPFFEQAYFVIQRK